MSLTIALKRASRIYPGFVVSSHFCLTVVAPLAGAAGPNSAAAWLQSVIQIMLLEPPYIPGTFPGTNYHSINGVMWTIGVEVRCYLMVLCFGYLRLFQKPGRICLIMLTFLFGAELLPQNWWQKLDTIFILGRWKSC